MSSGVFSPRFGSKSKAGGEGECLLGTFQGEADVSRRDEVVHVDGNDGGRGDGSVENEAKRNGREEEGERIVENEDETLTINELGEQGRERDVKIEVNDEITSELWDSGGETKLEDMEGNERECETNEEGRTTEYGAGEDEKYASLAKPESSDGESELDEKQAETISIRENFDMSQECKRCFEILNENMELRKRSSSHSLVQVPPPHEDVAFEKSEAIKMFDETFSTPTDLQGSCKSCGCHRADDEKSFRGSAGEDGSAAALCESQWRSKHSLTLDLECRICHDTEGQDLISPCHCAGTSKWVHESCIIRWIRHTKTRQCEICTCPITVKRKKKPIDQWTRPSASCGPCNKLDIWYCFVLALCIFIIVAFIVLQRRYDVTDQIETTVIFVSIYVLCGMIIMMKVRYFWTWFVQRSSFWGSWKNLNEEWRIIEAREAAAVTPESPV